MKCSMDVSPWAAGLSSSMGASGRRCSAPPSGSSGVNVTSSVAAPWGVAGGARRPAPVRSMDMNATSDAAMTGGPVASR